MSTDGLGIPKPFTDGGHKVEVQADRGRVVCTECPWFMYLDDRESMYAAGRRHKSATTLR